MLLSKRAQSIKPSPTLAIDSKAKALKAQGVDIISFGTGEPDFDTPSNIKEAAKKAIDSGFTKYCPVAGTPDIKQAIIAKFKKDNNLEYKAEEIIVSCGAKHSLYNLFQAILGRGDELIVPAPYWVSYPDMAYLAEAKVKIVKTREEDGFRMKPEMLEKAVSKKTKALVMNSPSNPTGAAYTAEELKAIGDICVKHNVLIISDEIYEKLVFGGFKHVSIASLSPEIKQKTIVINGVSKSHAMTGWRIGYTAGSKEIIEAMTNMQSQSTSNPTSISLKAATEALNGPQDSVDHMRQEFEKRRDYIVGRLNAIKGVKCPTPQGAFYVFPNVKKAMKKLGIADDSKFAEFLLEKAKIAVVPGSAFGAPGYIRLSYATSMDNIKNGVDRLGSAVSGK